MKVLVIDIETVPQLGWFFGKLWDQHYISAEMVESHTDILCFAAQWLDEKQVTFKTWHDTDMLQTAWDLLDQADTVMTYNGKSFDIPHLNRQFVLAGMTPPSPYKQIDLYHTIRKQFWFESNKLGFVANQLLGTSKTPHEGFTLWLKCLQGDAAAWATMKKYNIQDVKLLVQLYEVLKPWLVSAPSVAAITGDIEVCPRPACGGELKKRGFAYTAQSKFQQFRCERCGSYTRSTKAISTAKIAGVAS